MPKSPEQRRAALRHYARVRYSRMTEEERQKFREKHRQWTAQRKARMTPEQRAIALQKQREHSKKYRLKPEFKERRKGYWKKWRSKPENRIKHNTYSVQWRLKNPEKYQAICARRNAKRYKTSRSTHPLWWKRPLNPHWPRPIAEAMRRLGWTVTHLAKLLGIPQPHACQCLRRSPYADGARVRYFNEERMEQLQRVFAEHGEFVDVLNCWPQPPEPVFIPPSDPPHHLSEEQSNHVFSVVETLKPRLRDAIIDRFYRGVTLEQAGDLEGVTREMIRLREAAALNALRHPTRRRQLEEAAEAVGIPV